MEKEEVILSSNKHTAILTVVRAMPKDGVIC
jgi:hypothetical protein